MTVQTNTNKAIFYGTGGTGPYTFNFRFFQNSDIVVKRTDTARIATTLVEGVDYTLTGATTYTGGVINLTTALSGGPPADILTVLREIDLVQPTSIRNQSAYFPSIIEDEFDRLLMQIQQVNELASTIGVTVSSAATNTIPLVSANVSGGDTTIDIKGMTAVMVSKDDATSNKLHIIDSSGATIEHLSEYRDGLQGMDETVFLVLNSTKTNWKKVS